MSFFCLVVISNTEAKLIAEVPTLKEAKARCKLQRDGLFHLIINTQTGESLREYRINHWY